MVVLYNKTTKKRFFFYLQVLTLCAIMALVGKRKTQTPSGRGDRQFLEEAVTKGKGLIC